VYITNNLPKIPSLSWASVDWEVTHSSPLFGYLYVMYFFSCKIQKAHARCGLLVVFYTAELTVFCDSIARRNSTLDVLRMDPQAVGEGNSGTRSDSV
jgi:hypothetical protein